MAHSHFNEKKIHKRTQINTKTLFDTKKNFFFVFKRSHVYPFVVAFTKYTIFHPPHRHFQIDHKFQLNVFLNPIHFIVYFKNSTFGWEWINRMKKSTRGNAKYKKTLSQSHTITQYRSNSRTWILLSADNKCHSFMKKWRLK